MAQIKPPRNDGSGICSDCEQRIPNYLINAGGLGYVSPMSDALPFSIKEAMLEGKKAYEAVPRPVCMKCYCLAWEQAYPGVPCSLQEVSDFIHADLGRAFRLGLLLTAPLVVQPPITEEGVTVEVSEKKNEQTA